MTRCSKCLTAWPNPDGCIECNPERLTELVAELKERAEISEECDVCNGVAECGDCDEKDDEIEELRGYADKYKAIAERVAAALQARTDRKARMEWAAVAFSEIAAVEHPAKLEDIGDNGGAIPVEAVQAGRSV